MHAFRQSLRRLRPETLLSGGKPDCNELDSTFVCNTDHWSIMRLWPVIQAVLIIVLIGAGPSFADDTGLPELARLQTEFSRIAAGQPPPRFVDPQQVWLPRLSEVGAERGPRARAILTELEALPPGRWMMPPPMQRHRTNPGKRHLLLDLKTYLDALDAVAPAGADPGRINRNASRDAIMIMQALHSIAGTSPRPDLGHGTGDAGGRFVARLPCRTVKGREGVPAPTTFSATLVRRSIAQRRPINVNVRRWPAAVIRAEAIGSPSGISHQRSLRARVPPALRWRWDTNRSQFHDRRSGAPGEPREQLRRVKAGHGLFLFAFHTPSGRDDRIEPCCRRSIRRIKIRDGSPGLSMARLKA